MIITRCYNSLGYFEDFSSVTGRGEFISNAQQLMWAIRVDEIINATNSVLKVLTYSEFSPEVGTTLMMSERFFKCLILGMSKDYRGHYIYPGADSFAEKLGSGLDSFMWLTTKAMDSLSEIIMVINNSMLEISRDRSRDCIARCNDRLNNVISMEILSLKKYLEGLNVLKSGKSFKKWANKNINFTCHSVRVP